MRLRDVQLGSRNLCYNVNLELFSAGCGQVAKHLTIRVNCIHFYLIQFMTLIPFLNSRYPTIAATIRSWFLSSDLEKTIGVVSESRLFVSLLYGSLPNKSIIEFAGTHGKDLINCFATKKFGIIFATEKLADMRGDDLIVECKRLQPGLASLLLIDEDTLLRYPNQSYKSPVIVASCDMLKEDQAMRRAMLCAIGGTSYRSASVPQDTSIDPIYTVKLSDYERNILEFYAAGLTIDEMAEKLPLTKSSVKTYSRNLMQKLGVGNRQKALVKAVELGLIEKIFPKL